MVELGVVSAYGRETKKCCEYERKINLNAMTGYPVAVPPVSFRSHVYPIYKPGNMGSEILKKTCLCSVYCSKNHMYDFLYLFFF